MWSRATVGDAGARAPCHRDPLTARATRSAHSSASAMIAICGFTPRFPGKMLESATYSRRVVWWRKSVPTTLCDGSDPMRAVPNMWGELVAVRATLEATPFADAARRVAADRAVRDAERLRAAREQEVLGPRDPIVGRRDLEASLDARLCRGDLVVGHGVAERRICRAPLVHDLARQAPADRPVHDRGSADRPALEVRHGDVAKRERGAHVAVERGHRTHAARPGSCRGRSSLRAAPDRPGGRARCGRAGPAGRRCGARAPRSQRAMLPRPGRCRRASRRRRHGA